jgi:hypothetical protein
MNATQFGAALEAFHGQQYAAYQDAIDQADAFDMAVEREMVRLGRMPMDEVLEELDLQWDSTITSLRCRLEDVVASRMDD